MTQHLYEYAQTLPWACTPEALEAMAAIAQRETLPDMAARFHGKPDALTFTPGVRRDDSQRMTMRDGVALIPIDGPIFRWADMFTEMSGGVTTDRLALDFQKALDDPAARAILFVIDSPGGEATGINELSDAIYAARSVKPSAAYIEGYGASAAYWIASATGRITADATAMVGSVGTVMTVIDPAKRARPTIEFVSKQSPKKRPDPHTEAGRAYLQSLVDRMTDVFVASVARNRAMDAERVLAVEGAMLVGEDAVSAGLVDALGSEEQAIQALIEETHPRGRVFAGMDIAGYFARALQE